MPSLDDRLRAVPFFRSLPAADLSAVAARLQPRTVRRGSLLFREGERADAMFLVESGELEVLHGLFDEPVAVLGAGSFAGELGLLLGEPRSATLRAASPARVFALSRADLEQLLTEHPAIARELSAELGRRLVSTTRRLASDGRSRTTAVLLRDVDRLRDALAAEGARDHVVVPLTRSRTPETRAQLDAADWVVADDELPKWMAARVDAARVIRVDRGTRWSTVARRVAGLAVGVALSSGGSKTVAHIGVLSAFEELGLRFDAVAGSSGGALVGVAFAAGVDAETTTGYIRELAALLRPTRWDLHAVPRTGLMKGKRVRDLFDRWFEGREFSDLSLPLLVVASDMHTGEEVVFDSGSLADAVRASMSVPGVFDPWRHRGRVLIDGGVTDPLPVGRLRDAGYERVIGSNVAGKDVDPTAEAGERLPNIVTVMTRTVNLMEAEVIKANLPLADVVIRPTVHASGSFDFTRIDEFIAAGRAAAFERAYELERLANPSS